MFLGRITVQKDAKARAYWGLLESVRTACGPRQRTVACLGELGPPSRRAGRIRSPKCCETWVGFTHVTPHQPSTLFAELHKLGWGGAREPLRSSRVFSCGLSPWGGGVDIRANLNASTMPRSLPRNQPVTAWGSDSPEAQGAAILLSKAYLSA